MQFNSRIAKKLANPAYFHKRAYNLTVNGFCRTYAKHSFNNPLATHMLSNVVLPKLLYILRAGISNDDMFAQVVTEYLRYIGATTFMLDKYTMIKGELEIRNMMLSLKKKLLHDSSPSPQITTSELFNALDNTIKTSIIPNGINIMSALDSFCDLIRDAIFYYVYQIDRSTEFSYTRTNHFKIRNLSTYYLINDFPFMSCMCERVLIYDLIF